LQYGIPDWFFCLGESAIQSVVGWVATMPIIVMASRLCPDGMEGTMYALIMSVNNLVSVILTFMIFKVVQQAFFLACRPCACLV
jgi:hypothetical protein